MGAFPGVGSVFPQLSCLCLPLFLSHRFHVSAASPLSDDVSSEDCLCGEKLKYI